MAKIITRAEYQWDGHEYVLLHEDSYEHEGPIAQCKGGGSLTPAYGNTASSSIDPATMGMLVKQSADLNRTNTAGTYGKSSWTIDPNTGRYTQNVELDPSQQKQLDTRNSIAEQMMDSAGKNLGDISNPFSYSDTVSDPARASFDSAKSRLMPQFDQQTRNFDQQMSNNGIPMGSEAYNKAERDLAQGQNDALTQAATTSANTQNTMDLTGRQQKYSDIAQELASQNTQQPTAGTQAAIDTTGNYDKLQGGVANLYNQAASKQAGGTSALLGLLAAFL